MYSGILQLSPTTVDIVLLGATQLEITAIVELCQNYIENKCNSKVSGVKEHIAYKCRYSARNCEVIDTRHMQKPNLKAKQADSADNSMYASPGDLLAAQMDTSESSGENLQFEESSQVMKSQVTSGHGQRVVDRSPFQCRKRRHATENGAESLLSEKSVSVLSSGSKTDNDPDWKPESRSATHQYNTRKHSRLNVHKPLSSDRVAVQKTPRKRLLSAYRETLPLQIVKKCPYSSISNHTATSTPVYCLPAWQQSRRLLLAARFLLIKQTETIDDGCLRCGQCKFKGFASRSYLRAHVLSRHRHWHCCFSCGRRFASFIALLLHRGNKHRHFPSSRSRGKKADTKSPSCQEVIILSRNKCGWCGQKFASRSKLLEHRHAVHRKRSDAPSSPAGGHRVMRAWCCCEKDCGMEFKYKDMLRIHMADQHPNVVFSCPECRFKTQVEQILKRYCSYFVYFYKNLLNCYRISTICMGWGCQWSLKNGK